MKIQTNNQPAFASLYRGGSVKNILKNNPTKEFKSELGSIERGIRKNNLHKKENVDVILGYTKQDGFYGIISSKEQGVPMNPSSECKVSKDKKSMNAFSEWVNAWDEAYDPKELEKFRKLMNFIKNNIKNA